MVLRFNLVEAVQDCRVGQRSRGDLISVEEALILLLGYKMIKYRGDFINVILEQKCLDIVNGRRPNVKKQW